MKQLRISSLQTLFPDVMQHVQDLSKGFSFPRGLKVSTTLNPYPMTYGLMGMKSICFCGVGEHRMLDMLRCLTSSLRGSTMLSLSFVRVLMTA
jgi:hypothetical protein